MLSHRTMHNFQHKHASGCWIEYEPSIGGRGLVARRMIVELGIPLDHEEPGFDLHAATERRRMPRQDIFGRSFSCGNIDHALAVLTPRSARC